MAAAAHDDTYDLGCGRCDRYQTAEPTLTPDELDGCLDLLGWIFARHPGTIRDSLHGVRPWAPILPGEIVG